MGLQDKVACDDRGKGLAALMVLPKIACFRASAGPLQRSGRDFPLPVYSWGVPPYSETAEMAAAGYGTLDRMAQY